MGHWQSFPTLEFHNTAYNYSNEVTNVSWINSYGSASLTTEYTPLTGENIGVLVFHLKGDGVNTYEVRYNIKKAYFTPSKATSPSNELIVRTVPGSYGVDGYTYDYIYIEQPKQFTISGVNPLMWEIVVSLSGVFSEMTTVDISVDPDLTVSSSSLNRSIQTESVSESTPTIQITFLPDGNFQDIASVTFDIENDKKLGCSEGKYKQLLSKSRKGTQQIHVFAPLITCYLAGEGDFSTEKMFSINKIVGPIWPEVFLYAMAKFILNRLMNGIFDMNILYRRHTKKFLEQLRKSEYSNFVRYFSKEQDKEMYFLR